MPSSEKDLKVKSENLKMGPNQKLSANAKKEGTKSISLIIKRSMTNKAEALNDDDEEN